LLEETGHLLEKRREKNGERFSSSLDEYSSPGTASLRLSRRKRVKRAAINVNMWAMRFTFLFFVPVADFLDFGLDGHDSHD
jgi:hypothetical protein